jgi:hypothetical protein
VILTLVPHPASYQNRTGVFFWVRVTEGVFEVSNTRFLITGLREVLGHREGFMSIVSNVVVESLTLLRRIRKVPGLDPGSPDTFISWFSLLPPGKCRNSTLN